jgi:23S rRNA (uridine2552-2'-O)-methyltransferase
MKSGNKWRDHYTDRAKDENWLARSVYKLEEIDRKYRLVRQGSITLDLGCYPGSWSQYCLKKTGSGGKVIGIDLQRPERVSSPKFHFIQADILDIRPEKLSQEIGEVNLVISDLAPQTTGNKFSDTCSSMVLVEKAYEIALAVLTKDGHFVCKVFEGEDFKDFKDRVSLNFDQTRVLRPSAVRKRSREVYLIGINFIKKRV